VYHVVLMTFGEFIRLQRETLKSDDKRFSVRQVAKRVSLEPAYLSKIERDEVAPPSEGKIVAIAKELKEDPDLLLAMAGKVSSDLLDVIKERPQLFGDLIRELKSQPEHAILRLVREVRDGEW
jgi:transcriptional regulator with XRE-family HTH domain